MLALFIFFFFTYGAVAIALRVLWAALEERSCVEFRKLFIPPRKSFSAGRALPCRFRIPLGALTCIMRYRAFAECFLLGRRCYARRFGAEVVSRNSRRGEFYGKSTSRSLRVSYCTSARIAYTVNAAVAVVHMHYPIIVAMTKVSRANRARATACWYAFASGIRPRISSANIITPATL